MASHSHRLSASGRSLGLVLCVGLIVPYFSQCLPASNAADPEFIKRASSWDSTSLATAEDGLGPSISPDGRYAAVYLTDSNELAVRQQVDGKELFRIAIDGMGFARLKPTFSQNSEFIATHSMPMNSDEGTSGILDRLIVHQCSTGKQLFEANLWLHPEVILFSNDWVIVAGESRRNGSKYCCEILRADNGSQVANLIIPVSSGIMSEYIGFGKLELDDTRLNVHATSNYASFFGGASTPSQVTYSWNWKRVLELSQQGENIVPVGSKLSLVYKRENEDTDPRAELTRLGAAVAPYYVQIQPGKFRSGQTYHSRFDEHTGEMTLYEEDPNGGLSINLSGVSLSDQELVGLIKKIPLVKELVFSHFQLNDLSHLSQIKGLQVIVTRRKLRTTDFAAIANLVALRSLPSRIESDDALTYVGRMNALESLSLATKEVTDTGINRITQMQSLKNVYLSETGISAHGLKILEAMPSLDSVYIDFGLGADDQALKILVGSQKIRKLVLGIYNKAPSQISDAGLRFVAGVQNLESLDLNYVPITDVGVEHLLDLKQLQMLDLRGTKITDSAAKILGRLPLLANLDVSYCQNLTDTGLQQLQHIGTLRLLKVSYVESGITKDGVSELRRLRPDLTILTGTEY